MTLEQSQWRSFGVFIAKFEHISQFFLVFLLFNLSRWMKLKVIIKFFFLLVFSRQLFVILS